MMADRKLALTLSAALVGALTLAGCSPEPTASAADSEESRIAADAARSAASAVDELVAANDALLVRVAELETRLAQAGPASPPARERIVERVIERPAGQPSYAGSPPLARDEDFTASDTAPAAFPAPRSDGYQDPAVLADVAVSDDESWRTRPAARDLPRPLESEPARDDIRREPTYRRLTIEAGTPLELEILDPISTSISQPGDRFRARLTGHLLAGRDVAIRDGAEVTGRVVDVRGNKRIGGRPALELELDTIELPDGTSTPIVASWSIQGKSQTPKDAATIGGATVGGAILGRIFDKGEGEVLGGLIGAAAGTAVARQRVGKPIVLEPGAALSMTLDAPLEVRIRR